MSLWGGITRLVGSASDTSIKWRDDRGKPVAIDPHAPHVLDADVSGGRVIRRPPDSPAITFSASPSRFRAVRAVLSWAGPLAMAAIWSLYLGSTLSRHLRMSYWPSVAAATMVFAMLHWAGRRFMSERSRRRAVCACVPFCLARGCCGVCGYSLAGTAVQSDGCCECTECGAAWKIARWRREFPLAFGSRGLTSARLGGPTLTDARGRRVGLLGRKTKPEVNQRIRAALHRVMTPTKWLVAAAAFVLSFAPPAISLATVPEATMMHLMLAIIGPGAVVPLIVASRRTEAINLLARELFDANACPHCEGAVPIEPAADGARVCPTCGSAWKHSIGAGVR